MKARDFRRARRGLTLTDVCASIVICVVLSGMVMAGGIFGAHERANRAKCANNLRQIALAAMMYATQEVRTGAFPRTYFDPTSGKVTAFTGWSSPASFEKDGPKNGPAANDVTAAFFLILKTQEITPETFVCPSSDAHAWSFTKAGKPFLVKDASNFPDTTVLSYSYRTPYCTKEATSNGWKHNNALGADVPLAADLNPGGEALTKLVYNAAPKDIRAGNSKNHGQDGQNVVYCDAHVEFQTTPFCGQGYDKDPKNPLSKDNIYTFGGPNDKKGGEGVVGPPVSPMDEVLLPTADMGKPATQPATTKPVQPPKSP